jgi:predicted MPP superfamily phosphohydrolase
MRNKTGWLIVVGFMILLDLYVFQVVKFLTRGAADRTRMIIHGIYWTVSIAAATMMFLLPYINYELWPKNARSYVFATIVGILFAKLIAATFFMVDDVRRGALWLMGRIFPNFGPKFIEEQGTLISRSAFLSWLGVGIGTTLYATLSYGFTNKYNYQVKRLKMAFDNLPKAFKGFKIVHISDIHSGSFNDKAAVQKGIDKILHEQPDVILFTGDLVNDRATEMTNYMDVFGQLKAKHGVFSSLGNHDYGDYVSWDSPEAKADNLNRLKQVHANLGWKLMMNKHAAIEKDGEAIAILGIENWSAKGRFPKYGKLHEAYPGAEKYPFKILLSHDPSHWDAEVKTKYPDIDLMLSGHTHGMQFGLENPYFKWSPVQWMYKQWAGLYEDGNQKLYINRGFGFIGYPGRVGILPEITVIELV